MATQNVGVKVFQNANDTTRLSARAIRRNGHPVHLHRNLHLARKVGHKHDGTLQHTDQQHVFANVTFVDFGSQLFDFGRDLFFGDENLGDLTGNL